MMVRVKIARGCLIGTRWREPGEVVSVPEETLEGLFGSGSAVYEDPARPTPSVDGIRQRRIERAARSEGGWNR